MPVTLRRSMGLQGTNCAASVDSEANHTQTEHDVVVCECFGGPLVHPMLQPVRCKIVWHFIHGCSYGLEDSPCCYFHCLPDTKLV